MLFSGIVRTPPRTGARSSVRLLLGELGELVLYIRPRFVTLNNAADGTVDSVLVRPHLLRAVPVTQGEAVVFDRLKVNCDAKRGAEFIVSRVTLANARGRVVDPVRDSEPTKSLTKTPDQRSEVGMVGKRNNQHLGRCNGRRERKDLYVR